MTTRRKIGWGIIAFLIGVIIAELSAFHAKGADIIGRISVFSTAEPDPLNKGATNFVRVEWNVEAGHSYTILNGPPQGPGWVSVINDWWTGPGASIYEGQSLTVRAVCIFGGNGGYCPDGAIFDYDQCGEGCSPTLILIKPLRPDSEFFKLRQD
jgi:hypothetical protein